MQTFDPSTSTHQAPSSVWAVVLSRAGSKRLPNKAMRPLHGRPMASWVFDALSACNGLTRRSVFTDDNALLDLLGRNFPDFCIPTFERPPALSRDTTTSIETLRYFLNFWPLEALPPWVMLCQCTSPLVQTGDYQAAIKLASTLPEGSQDHCIISVSPPAKPMNWLFQEAADGTLHRYGSGDSSATHGTTYFPNGAFYVFPTALIYNAPPDFSWMTIPHIHKVVMPWQRSIDIDTYDDFFMAEAMLSTQKTFNSEKLIAHSPLERRGQAE